MRPSPPQQRLHDRTGATRDSGRNSLPARDMSGVISVTLRMPTGETTKMLWPSSRLRHLQVPGLPEGDAATLERLTVVGHGPWRGARPWPSRPGHLQPAEYGLVVVDLATDRIITHQGAMDLRSISLISLIASARNPARTAAHRRARAASGENDPISRLFEDSADPKPREGEVQVGVADGPWFADADSDAAHAEQLYARHRLTHLLLAQLNTAVAIRPGLDFGTLLTELHLVADALTRHPDPWAGILADLRINWNPLELIDVSDDEYGGERFYQLLQEAGMTLTPSEERGWRHHGWLRRRRKSRETPDDPPRKSTR
jgi:hypothetical protein